MKYILLLVPLMSLLMSCSSLETSTVKNDPYIAPMVAEFNRLYHTNFNPEFVMFVNKLNNDAVGYAPPNTVYLLESYWDEQDKYGKEALLFHELGHAVLNREHDDAMNGPLGCPKSLMHSELHNKCYRILRAYYLKELGR